MKKIMRSWRIKPELIKRLIQAGKTYLGGQTAMVERGIELVLREQDKKQPR